MENGQTFRIIGHIRSDFDSKFGIPRQSGLVEELRSVLVFEPEFQDENALRGLEEFSHIWVIWDFSEAHRDEWSPTVRPPRLGGNERLGVFATRSPFRPNPIGLSCVRLIEIKKDPELGSVLVLGGADMMDGTPVYDIKPYIPYADCRSDASAGFTAKNTDYKLKVEIPPELENKIKSKFNTEKYEALTGILAQDPRPHYQDDPERVYGFSFAGTEIKFRVSGRTVYLLDIKSD